MWFYVLDLASFLHWALMGKSSARRSRGFVPSAECFEDRCVPCATGLGVDPILVSAIPVEQMAQASLMGDGATYKPTESLSIQDSERGGDAGTPFSFSWGENSLAVGGLAEDHVEGSPDDPSAIYGFNPQPDPPGFVRDIDMLAIDSFASGISEWSWGETSTNPSNDKLTLACSNNLRPGSAEVIDQGMLDAPV